jgi:hypothetical protein
VVAGTIGEGHQAEILPGDQALTLLAAARPDENTDTVVKEAAARQALDAWTLTLPVVRPVLEARAKELEASHKRVRQAVKMRVREFKVVPQMPPDLLGVLVLLPAATR